MGRFKSSLKSRWAHLADFFLNEYTWEELELATRDRLSTFVEGRSSRTFSLARLKDPPARLVGLVIVKRWVILEEVVKCY